MYEEVSQVDPTTANNPLGPTTTIRSASTAVLVQNHRTAVIGGLLSTDENITNQGVPFFSSIPFLGNLFSDKSRTRDKDNLLVFLTPHIVRNKAELRELSLDERQRYVTSLGRKEMHDMPASQIHEIYKPSFSISVPPAVELNAPYTGAGAPESATPFTSSSAGAVPNATEIAPAAGAAAPPAMSSTVAASAPMDSGTGTVTPFNDTGATATSGASKSGTTPAIAP
jgi:general secretion pathway protein D